MRTLTGFLLALAGFAQTPQFEVASVKPHAPGQLSRSNITTGPGRLRADYVDIKQLIAYAYDVSPLVIAADLPATRFDVEGKAEGAHTSAELRLMLQALLGNRFGLRLHRETRELSVDALVIGKSPKLQASELTDPDPGGFVLHAGKLRNHVAVEGHAISLPGLANYLSNHHRDRLIVDATGLKGVYDFSVDYEIDIEKVADRNVSLSDATASLMDDLANALGLKIESGRRLPVEMLVIDKISPPHPN
jgi:uncharacterized protein (TIGR03435 family)